MIRITKQSDYGILMLTDMASRSDDDVHTARDLARRSGLSVPMVAKILKPLARNGIVASHRGVKGGYSLSRSADEITLGEIIEALEGPIGMTECVTNPGSCHQEPHCPVKVNWGRISSAVRGALEHIPLSEMIGPDAPAGGAAGEALLSIGS